MHCYLQEFVILACIFNAFVLETKTFCLRNQWPKAFFPISIYLH